LLGAVAAGAPLTGASAASAAPGCTAQGTGVHTCRFTITGFDVITVQGVGVKWNVTVDDPFTGRTVCTSGNEGAVVATCSPLDLGAVVTATVQTGLITVREI
jgi:hypothetical protein